MLLILFYLGGLPKSMNNYEFCVTWKNKVVIPFQFKEKILSELHENHPGIVKMKALARSYVWWPNIKSEIQMTVKSC